MQLSLLNASKYYRPFYTTDVHDRISVSHDVYSANIFPHHPRSGHFCFQTPRKIDPLMRFYGVNIPNSDRTYWKSPRKARRHAYKWVFEGRRGFVGCAGLRLNWKLIDKCGLFEFRGVQTRSVLCFVPARFMRVIGRSTCTRSDLSCVSRVWMPKSSRGNVIWSPHAGTYVIARFEKSLYLCIIGVYA